MQPEIIDETSVAKHTNMLALTICKRLANVTRSFGFAVASVPELFVEEIRETERTERENRETETETETETDRENATPAHHADT